MKTWTMISAAAGCLFMSAPARSEFYDGNRILERCESPDIYEKGICLGFVIGATDSLMNFRRYSGRSECVRDSASAGQVRDIVVKYLKDNPATRDDAANSLAIQAIVAAFCPGKP